MVITWSGLTTPLSAKDWISIAPAGSAATTVSQWQYTGGAASGTTTFAGSPAAGTYVARAYSDDTYTMEGESAPFTIASGAGGTVTLAANGTSFFMNQDITLSFTGMPGNQHDWVTIAPAGSADTVQQSWRYIFGQTSGSVTFVNGLSYTGLYRSDAPELNAGMYVARAFLNDTYVKVAETAPFFVGATITTDASQYQTYGTIKVNFDHMPGTTDWIALAPMGSDVQTTTMWVYTNNATTGSVTFTPGLAATGSYRARAYTQDTYAYQGESPVFTVVGGGTPLSLTTDHATYPAGGSVIVTWSGAPGNDKDWIDVAPQGSTVTTISRGATGYELWTYLHSATTGSYTFSAPNAPGTYVARMLLNDGYTLIIESASFTVQ